MANKRTMKCGHQVYAIGQEGSQADKKEKRDACLMCECGTTSQDPCEYRDFYINQ